MRRDGSHISESQTKTEFHDNFNILVVVEKYQTGFDEPLLHTMIANTKEEIVDAFQPFYQETSLEQEVNVDLMYQTQRELRDYAIYNDNDIIGFIEGWNRPGAQKKNSMGQMTSVLKQVADRYNLKNLEERYQFRRQARSLVKWYSYISQVVRMFDRETHNEYLFLRYLIDIIPAEKEEDVDLGGKLELEYYKLKKTFEGAIQLENMDGQYETVTDK